MPKVKFLREKKELDVALGANLRLAALDAGIEVYPGLAAYLNCRGKGLCGTCRMLVKGGTVRNCSPKGWLERLRLFLAPWAIGHEQEVRLSCQAHVLGDLEVETQAPKMNWSGEFE
ncbi:MAG: (2Fe-2S)-binding protein [Planctomycetales bacterium]|nr:(2Fe-2S)-binding protein [Planctomycetales bacterium]